MGLFHSDPKLQICPVSRAEKERIEITIDSGAAESMMPKHLCQDYPMTPGAWTGSLYGTADGGTITNLGERLLVMDLQEGQTRGMQFQVGDKCTKPLGAVSRIVDKGNRVVFEDTHGYIENKATFEKTFFERKDDVYVLNALVRPFNEGFRRQS